jgi:hypothetical protein
VTRWAVLAAIVAVLAAGSAAAAPLPGLVTPSGNIHCFVVPVSGSTHSDLICNIARAAYATALAQFCQSQPQSGLDWKGFELQRAAKGKIVCVHGILHKPSDTPTFRTLGYGKTWHRGVFTCVLRRTGLTCRNGARHGVFLGRRTYRLF